MKHDHSKFQRKIGIRKFQRNFYKHLPKDKDDSVLITNRGKAMYFVNAASNGEENNHEDHS